MADDFSGVTSLQFGGEMAQVDGSAVDMAVAVGPIGDTIPTRIPMPQAGCIRGLSLNCETGVASTKTATLAVTIGGVEDSSAVIALAASTSAATAQFGNGVMTFDKDDEIGISLTGSTTAALVAQESTATVLVQFGRSNI